MDEHIRATEPDKYTIFEWDGQILHLCDCDSDLCTFDSCNITNEPSKCEVVGCNGIITKETWSCDWKINPLSNKTGCWGQKCNEAHIESCDTCHFSYKTSGM